MEKIYLTEEGFLEFQDNINKLKEKMNKIQREKSEACSGAVGDGWHDNFAYEEAKRNEDTISSQIKLLIENSRNIEIIKKWNYVVIKLILAM